MIAGSYLMKRKIKKKILEVIFNTKIFNIKFCFNKVANDHDFAKITEGTRQRGTGQRRIRYCY